MTLVNGERAAEWLERAGVDALVLGAPVNITYFTDYYSWMDPLFKDYMTRPGGSADRGPTFGVYAPGIQPVVVLGPVLGANAIGLPCRPAFFGTTAFEPAAADVDEQAARHLEALALGAKHATAADALAAVVEEEGLADARIGVDMDGTTASSLALVRAALPKAQLRDASNLIRLIRAVKSDEEQRRMRRAAEVAEAAALASLASLRAGASIRDGVRAYRTELAKADADFDHYAFGLRGLGIAMEPDMTLRAGEPLYLDFGCVSQRYFSDSGFTVAPGGLNDLMRRRYDGLAASIDAGAAAMRPGARASDVRRAMQEALDDAGGYASFPHGHGLGLELRDYPILVEDTGLPIRDDCVDVSSDLALEPGMVLNVEAGLFAPGEGSLQIERTFLVGPDGAAPLTEQNRAEPYEVPA
jgi:Xaa-Pro aminopeptidase